MATGRLYTPTQLGTGNTTIYIVPNSTYSVCNVSLTNTSSSPVTIRLAISTAAAPTSPGPEWIEWDTTIVAKGVFERTGLVLSPNLYLVALASTGAVVNATVYGIETATA
jgi:hypothetical protein